MTKIVIKVRGPTSSLSLRVESNQSVEQFYERVRADLGISNDIDILIGFPPTILPVDNEKSMGELVKNGESVRVQNRELSGVQRQGVAKAPRKPNQKQGAASIATAAALQSSLSPQVATLGGALRASAAASPAGRVWRPLQFGATIASLSNPTGRIKQSTRNMNTSNNSNSNSSRRRRSIVPSAQSTGDISEHLLEAVTAGSTGSRNKSLRQVFRKAVEFQYNEAQALARLQALYAGRYNIVETRSHSNNNLESGSSSSSAAASPVLSKIRVSYRKGLLNSQKMYEEEVDLIPQPLLAPLLALPLQSEEEREVLKPLNLSKASPRIFWSLVFHHGGDLVGSIVSLTKREADERGVDLAAWLGERKRELSEKAREHKRAAEEREREKAERKEKREKKKRRVEGAEEKKGEEETESSRANKLLDVLEDTLLRRVGDPLFLSYLSSSLSPAQYEQILFLLSPPTSSSSPSSPSLLSRFVLHYADTDRPPLSEGEAGGQLRGKVWGYCCSVGRDLLHSLLFHFLLHCSMKLKILCFKLRIRSLGEMLLWRGAARGLGEALREVGEQTGGLKLTLKSLYSEAEREEGGEERRIEWERAVEEIVEIGERIGERFPFLLEERGEIGGGEYSEECEEFIRGEEEAFDLAAEGREEMWSGEEESQWIFCVGEKEEERRGGGGEYLGKSCRIFTTSFLTEGGVKERDEEEGEGKEDGEGEGKGEGERERRCWEEGRVVAYLPPTSAEPMALYRVRLDSVLWRERGKGTEKGETESGRDGGQEWEEMKRGRFEDLEEEEVKVAIENYLHCRYEPKT